MHPSSFVTQRTSSSVTIFHHSTCIFLSIKWAAQQGDGTCKPHIRFYNSVCKPTSEVNAAEQINSSEALAIKLAWPSTMKPERYHWAWLLTKCSVSSKNHIFHCIWVYLNCVCARLVGSLFNQACCSLCLLELMNTIGCIRTLCQRRLCLAYSAVSFL